MNTLDHRKTSTAQIKDSAFDSLCDYHLVDSKEEWNCFKSFVNEKNFMTSAGVSAS